MASIDTEDFISLVQAREARTGEWLGSEYIEASEDEGDDEPYLYFDEDHAISQAEARYERGVYGR